MEYEKLVIYLRSDDKQNILQKRDICCAGMSESELGRRAIFQYLDIALALKDKRVGSFYTVRK